MRKALSALGLAVSMMAGTLGILFMTDPSLTRVGWALIIGSLYIAAIAWPDEPEKQEDIMTTDELIYSLDESIDQVALAAASMIASGDTKHGSRLWELRDELIQERRKIREYEPGQRRAGRKAKPW